MTVIRNHKYSDISSEIDERLRYTPRALWASLVLGAAKNNGIDSNLKPYQLNAAMALKFHPLPSDYLDFILAYEAATQ